ncbi:ATP-grasp fold amidoligase family protein [Virgibacillus xinjiangensis]|uniref:ATP-grasp fold amidoligase family protein n=1 Tax=Virgibacillus xinjiangensis TaxID=393090 RepID=A0ABV7CTR5_9BACI
MADNEQGRPQEDVSQPPRSQEKQELIKELMKTEAEIADKERAILQNKKEMKKVKNSNAWKVTAPIRKFQSLFWRLKGKKKKELFQKLYRQQEEIDRLKEEVYAAKDRLADTMLDDRRLNSSDMLRKVKEQKQEGNLLGYIEQMVQQKHQHETNYNMAFRYAARTFMNEKEEYKKLVYERALEGFKLEDIPEFLVRQGLTDNPIELTSASSYRGSLNMRMRKQQLAGTMPEQLLDHKQTAFTFMKGLGVRVPWSSEHSYTLKELPQQEGIVIKPEHGAGSRGVYLIYSHDDIIDIKRSVKLDSWQALQQNMKKDMDSGWVEQDQWYMEELIVENKKEKKPASDVKFYCFYGKVGLILEITRYPERKYCWWTSDGKRVHTGKYEENPYLGKGVTKEEVELAASISGNIPAPFMRIDFLRSEDGLIFGEFTPKPGNYDEFDQETDRWLGDMFLEADARLMSDLLDGVQWDDFWDTWRAKDKG